MKGWSSFFTRALVIIIPLVLIGAAVTGIWPQPREVIYDLYREHGRGRTLSGLTGYHLYETKHFLLYYKPVDQKVVELVAEVAEEVYSPVLKSVGYIPNNKVPLIIYPDRTELRQAFGWNRGVSAVGVYYKGTIRLLSPNAWIDAPTDREQRRAFKKLNPLAHELTHYLLDYLTSGNYPRWFTEGLAQVVEYRISGYLWLESQSTLRQRLFTLSELQYRFDQLPNQALAYRQSYLLVDHMRRTYGEERLASVVERIGQGMEFRLAVRTSFGASMEEIYEGWQAWVADNLDELDASS